MSDRRDQIEHFYRLALGRWPEPGADLGGLLSADHPAALIFGSSEFRDRVASAYARGAEPVDGLFNRLPPSDLTDWAAGAFGLTPAAAARARRARGWAQLYLALFEDEGRLAGLGLERRPFDTLAWDGLRALAEAQARRHVVGALEQVSGTGVHGWAVDLEDPARRTALELWADGVFVSAGTTGVFRRDIQEHHPGADGAGFVLPSPRLGRGGAVRLELREAGRPEVIAETTVTLPDPAEALTASVARRELDAARQALARLEAMMPSVEAALTDRLEDWDAYVETWYRPAWRQAARRTAPGRSAIRIRIDAAGRPADWVEEAIESALEQSRAAAGVFVAGLDAQGRKLVEDSAARRGWTAGRRPAVACGEPKKGGGPVLAFPACGVLAPDAVEAVEALFAARPDAAVLYVDEDVLAADAEGPDDWRERPHRDPVLKPGFDLDLLRGAPWVGDCLAFAGDAAAGGPEAVLSVVAAGGTAVGLPRVLFSRRQEAPPSADAQAWAGAVRDHLARMGETAEVAPLADSLGAAVPGAVRLNHRLPEGATATVIIPTRDRADLIGPCLDSLEAHRGANRCAMKILVVDHDSRDPETRALLEARRDAGGLDILPYDGTFNWALMNNQAAAQADGDVLVFLNDDTLALSPDWLDALVRQALRPGVGVVGARLVYQDGTIQHAGMIARPRDRAFLIHEGVGIPGSEPGYLGRHALTRGCMTVTGACMAVSAQVFRRLGGFDAARLPIEGNDVDLCLRARAEGLAVIYEPAATLYHLESKSRGLSQAGERLRLSQEATRRVWNRWGQRFKDDPAFNPHFARDGRPFDRLRPPPPATGA
ncbi:MAG: glycosyltransferase family 2 protein [Brevundimonas sp.]|uniref:glycosyltransferase family 2 protein n=1 Tax=Brevundimonas sp. TaxID=1871086 RepID=UPI0025BA2F84|nr:glycosyltransferase family 2 protein [Brevundimonas sp.]MBX3478321.1 glycosyltransferase family 2 protein [Brevundimonas sp.]